VKTEFCNGGESPCGHLTVNGAVPFCNVFRKPIADVVRCGPKLVKAALKRRKLDRKLKGRQV